MQRHEIDTTDDAYILGSADAWRIVTPSDAGIGEHHASWDAHHVSDMRRAYWQGYAETLSDIVVRIDDAARVG